MEEDDTEENYDGDGIGCIILFFILFPGAWYTVKGEVGKILENLGGILVYLFIIAIIIGVLYLIYIGIKDEAPDWALGLYLIGCVVYLLYFSIAWFDTQALRDSCGASWELEVSACDYWMEGCYRDNQDNMFWDTDRDCSYGYEVCRDNALANFLWCEHSVRPPFPLDLVSR